MNAVGSQTSGFEGRKCAIITGDDFGLNSQVNEAIEAAHQSGVLTQTSLMVNEPGVEEALRIARRNPGLLVGLHLTLCCGRASQPSRLTDRTGILPHSPAAAGLRYAFLLSLQNALREEIAAQFQQFTELGFPPVYWDGHTHLHLHPTVLKLTLPIASAAGFRVVRLVQEQGGGILPAIFRRLSAAAIPRLDRFGICYTGRTFGLRETGRVDTRVIERYLEELPDGWSEIYMHPGADPGTDWQLLRELIDVKGIRRESAKTLAARCRPA